MRKNWLPLLAVILLGATAVFWWMNQPHSMQAKPAGSAQATLSGDFDLINQYGERVTQENFRGQYLLVFFGFTYCPDICPMALATITQAIQQLEEKGARVTPVFITVDPGRDTPEQLHRYAQAFHPRLQALTGDAQAIESAKKAYGVYAVKASEEEDYLMNHSGYIYLMGASGEYLAHFPHHASAEEVAKHVVEVLE